MFRACGVKRGCKAMGRHSVFICITSSMMQCKNIRVCIMNHFPNLSGVYYMETIASLFINSMLSPIVASRIACSTVCYHRACCLQKLKTLRFLHSKTKVTSLLVEVLVLPLLSDPASV